MLSSARPRSTSSPQSPNHKSWSPPPCSFRPPQLSHRIHPKKSASSLQSFTTISGNSSSDSSSPRRPTHTRPNNSEPQSPAFGHRPRKGSHRPRSSTSLSSQKFLFTPASTPPLVCTPHTHSYSRSLLPPKKSLSSPLLSSPRPVYPSHSSYPKSYTQDSEDDQDEEMIFTSWSGSGATTTQTTASLRTRIFGGANGNTSTRVGREKLKSISTTPGLLGAGETETEADEPPHHLPTSRIIHSSGPLVPPNTLQQRLTPLLFECSRLLSIVPAVFGTLYNLYRVYNPPNPNLLMQSGNRRPPERVDFLVSALWAILTGFQCLRLTTGLLTRWRLYYPPLPTLIRLIALQAICWPATHLTLSILEHQKRPVIVWAVIGTTTSVSRSVQIWVTSNLWWEKRGVGEGEGSSANGAAQEEEHNSGYWKRWGGGKWGGRRWDWKDVGIKCVLPAGIVYVIMAWAEALRREWSGC